MKKNCMIVSERCSAAESAEDWASARERLVVERGCLKVARASALLLDGKASDAPSHTGPAGLGLQWQAGV